MPPKSGLHGFVQQRNTPQDVRNTGSPANPDFQDLKQPVPKSSSKSNKNSKTKQKQGGAGYYETRQPARQGQFRDDASSRLSNDSSTDALSTTASTSRPRVDGFQQAQTYQNSHQRNAVDGDHLSAAFGGTDFTDDMTDDLNEGLQQGFVPTNGAQIHPTEKSYQDMVHASKADKASPTIAQTQIKGDSYPPTSTGVPSMTDEHEQSGARASIGPQYEQNQVVQPVFVSSRGNKPQVHASSARHQQMPHRDAHIQRPVSSRQPHKTSVFDPEPGHTEHDFDANFTYERPAKKEVAIHSSHAQRPKTALYSHKDAQPQFLRQTALNPNGQALLFKEQVAHPTHIQRERETHNQKNGRGRSFEQVHITEQAPPSEAYTDDAGEQAEGQESYANRLDYDLPELVEKDLKSLQSEQFDGSMSAQPFIVADMPDSATLAEKMALIANSEQKTQSEFFASLNINEWEDAGDWFIDSFGETIKRFKEVRKAKRKAALAFEEEIEKREAAVNKKHALTTAALGDMKTNGMAVLQGTPRKGQ